MRRHTPPVGHRLDEQQSAPALGKCVPRSRNGQSRTPVGDLHPHAAGLQKEADAATAAGYVPDDVGEELRHREFGRVGHLQQARTLEMEARAAYLSTYQAQLVYGLLQTKEYARAVLATGIPDDLDGLVAARMERQRILNREQPPVTWVVLDEAVLLRPVGGHEVMRRQLAHLLEFTRHRWVHVQVLPSATGEHASLDGAFTTMRFNDDPDIIYTEDLISGHMTANPETTREAARRYAHLQAAALSIEDSAALIKRVMEERYGNRPEPEERAVA